jgi:hypothetical protein
LSTYLFHLTPKIISAILIPMKQRGFISVNEAARIKGCSRQTIHRAIQTQKLEAKTENTIIWKVSLRSLAKLKLNPKMKRAGRPRAKGLR